MYILKVYSIHYTLRKNKKVLKICVGQNKRYKKYLLFLSRASTHHSFTFNLRFSYELNHMVRLSKTVFGIFNFRLCFNRRSYFCSTKCTDSLNLKHHNFFQIWNNRKATRSFTPRSLIVTLQQKGFKIE